MALPNDSLSAKGLRVALLTNFLPPYRVPLLRHFARQGAHLSVFVSVRSEANRRWECAWDGLEVHVQKSVTFPKTWRHPAGFLDTGYVHLPLDTYQRLRNNQPDVVLSGELGLRSLLALLYRCTGHGRRSRLVLWATVSEHTEAARGWTRMRLRKLLLRRADAVIVNGASGLRYVTGLGAKPDKVFLVPYVADVTRFQTARRNDEGYKQHRLLYVGQLTERKGLQPFTLSLRDWANRRANRFVEFLLAGDGPLASWFRSLDMPTHLRLNLLGHVPYDALPEIYSQCGVFVFPTLADEWGLAVNEAMAASLPVLGSVYSQAVEELVEDGVNGWRFRPDRPEDVVRAVDHIFNTPADKLACMGASAARRVQGLTPQWAAGELWKVIEHVSRAHPARP